MNDTELNDDKWKKARPETMVATEQDEPLDDKDLESKARYLWENLIEAGQRLAIVTDEFGKGKIGRAFNECFDPAQPFWRNICRRHVAYSPAVVELHLVKDDRIVRGEVTALVLGVYYGGVSGLGNNVAKSYALDCDKIGDEGRRLMDLAMRNLPEAQFFANANGKWHAHGRLEAIRPARQIRLWLKDKLPAELQEIEVFPKASNDDPHDDYRVGNYIRLPFSPETRYEPVGQLHPIQPESATYIPTLSDLKAGCVAERQTPAVRDYGDLENDIPVSQREQWARGYARSIGSVKEGERHQKTFAVAACCLKNHALPEDKTLEITAEFNRLHCCPPLDASEIEKQVRDAETYGSGSLWTPEQIKSATKEVRDGGDRDTRSPKERARVSPLSQNGLESGKGKAPEEDPLPDVEDAICRLGANLPAQQPDLWQDVVKLGGKLFLGGPSKARKSFSLIGLAVAVAKGAPFWGKATRRSRVLYLNLEINSASFYNRLDRVSKAMKLPLDSGQLTIWNLRGHARAIELLVPKILEKVSSGGYGLIVIDPVYKCLGRRNENDAGDMTSFCNELEKIAQQAGATVVAALHYAKGNASGKEAMDRISGSGVLARDPDAMVMLTPHETDGAFTVSTVLRDHPPLAEWVVRWDFPLMSVDDDLNPRNLKKSDSSPAAGILDILIATPERDCSDNEWKSRAVIEADVRTKTGAAVKKISGAFAQAFEKGYLSERTKKRAGTNALKLYRRSDAGEAELASPDAVPHTIAGQELEL